MTDTDISNQTSESAKARDRALRRARGLLATAESFSGQGQDEAAVSYTEQAMKILADHGLHEAMLEDGKVDSRDVMIREISLEAPQAAEKGALLGAIARCYDARMVMIWPDWSYGKKDKKTGKRKIHFKFGKGGTAKVYGFAGDLEQIELLYTMLLLQSTQAMLAEQVPYGTRPADFRSAFLYGFRDAIYVRLWRIRKAAKQEADEKSGNGRGMELVLADRKALVDRRYEEENADAQSSTEFRGTVGRDAGHRAGLTADLHQTRVTEDSPAGQIAGGRS